MLGVRPVHSFRIHRRGRNEMSIERDDPIFGATQHARPSGPFSGQVIRPRCRRSNAKAAACVVRIGPMLRRRWSIATPCSTRLERRPDRQSLSSCRDRVRAFTMDAIAVASQAEPLTHREARLIVIGMLLPVFMGSLDQTILASALPTIGRDLGNAHDLPWLITAYLLASTAVVPLYGKIADIHGRRFTLRIGIALYMLGSLVCAFAPSMLILILGRVLHGIGGGGLASIGAVVLGDVASPKERGRYYGYFAVIYTTAGACGPVLGGFLADHLHWSAIFWLNIPLGLAALIVTSTVLRRLPRHERPHRLDLIGAALIVAASLSFMLALNLAGTGHGWTSLPILALFAVALGMAVLFVLRLITAPEPLIPISILLNPVVRNASVANAFGWGSIVGLNIFLPTYLQTIVGLSPTDAGLSLMVIMVALNISAGLAGHVLGRATHYKTLPILALLVAIAAVLTLAWQADRLNLWSFELLLTLIGAGFGPLPALTQVVVQNSVGRHQLGISVATMNFSRSLLSTMLVALFGAIVLTGATTVEPAPGALAGAFQHDAAHAVEAFRRVFVVAGLCLAVALVAIMLMEERPLQTDGPQQARSSGPDRRALDSPGRPRDT
jgi:EmrB/QacA subfamily drug resistance transporter